MRRTTQLGLDHTDRAASALLNELDHAGLPGISGSSGQAGTNDLCPMCEHVVTR